MKEYVNVKEFIEEVDAMAKRGTLLARGGVTQEDLAMQIKGIAVHVAMKGQNYMKKVKCISVRPMLPKQIEVDKIYYMDETTKWKDCDGDEYATFYSDKLGDNKIGNMLLSHFCMMEDGNCMSCDTCNN